MLQTIMRKRHGPPSSILLDPIPTTPIYVNDFLPVRPI